MEVQYDILWVTMGKGVSRLVTSMGQRENEKSNLGPSDSALQCSATEPQRLYGKRGPLQSSYMTHVLHTAKISDIYSVMFVTRTRKMVNFELRKEIEKDVFRLVTSMGQSVVEHRSAESEGLRFDSLWGLRIFFFALHS